MQFCNLFDNITIPVNGRPVDVLGLPLYFESTDVAVRSEVPTLAVVAN